MTDGITVWDSTSFTVGWDVDMRVFIFSGFTFEFSKTYDVTIDSSIARSIQGVYLDGDQDGTPMGSPIDDHVWSFTTEPTPTVTGTPTGSNIELDSNIVDSFGVSSFDNMAKTFTVDPFSLLNGVPYNITLSGDALAGAKDLNGNSLDGNKNSILEGAPTDDYSWEFITVAIDDVPPQVVTTTPSDGATNVPLNSNILITFNELMNEGTFPTGIAAKVNMTTFSLEPFADYEWYTNRTLILIPKGGMEYDTEYIIIISGSQFDGVRDLADNLLDGDKDGVEEGSPQDDHRFTFRTMDPIPPYITNTTPYADESHVIQNTTITATFDDVMDESTITSDNVTVRDELSNLVSGNLTYDPQLKTLSFDPYDNLWPAMTYTVTVSNVSDDDGNLMISPYSWSFTTALDVEPPVVTIVNPQAGFTTTSGDEVIITGTAFDNSGIQSLFIRFDDGPQIDLMPDYNPVDGTWIYTWDTRGQGSGDVTINVTAYDRLLLWGSDEVSVDIKEKPAEDLTWLILVVMALVIAIVATLLFLLMWRRRRETAEDEVIAEEVRKEMDEEREAEEEESPEEVEEEGEPDEVIDVEEVEEGEEAEEEPEEKPQLKKPVRRVKK
jgi:hypothetical protein